MGNMHYHHRNTTSELAQLLAEDVATRLKSAIAARGKAILVVSGGSTPKPFFACLSKQTLDWEKVIVTLADERCVDESDHQSNALLVKEHLLTNHAATATFKPLYTEKPTHQESASAASDLLAELPRYDVVVLGMGGDGHTASIFPEAANRDQALDPWQSQQALLVDPVTVTPLRVTQTLRRLLHTGYLALHITGEEKAQLLAHIIQNPKPETWPIAALITQDEIPLHIYSDSSTAAPMPST